MMQVTQMSNATEPRRFLCATHFSTLVCVWSATELLLLHDNCTLELARADLKGWKFHNLC